MATVDCIKCEWCDKLTPQPKYTSENSPIIGLWEVRGRSKDFCNRECLLKYLDRNQDIGVIK